MALFLSSNPNVAFCVVLRKSEERIRGLSAKNINILLQEDLRMKKLVLAITFITAFAALPLTLVNFILFDSLLSNAANFLAN